MEPEKLTKEKAKELMKVAGETRGISIKGDLEYIIYREGKESLAKLEERSAELGFPIKYEELRESLGLEGNCRAGLFSGCVGPVQGWGLQPR